MSKQGDVQATVSIIAAFTAPPVTGLVGHEGAEQLPGGTPIEAQQLKALQEFLAALALLVAPPRTQVPPVLVLKRPDRCGRNKSNMAGWMWQELVDLAGIPHGGLQAAKFISSPSQSANDGSTHLLKRMIELSVRRLGKAICSSVTPQLYMSKRSGTSMRHSTGDRKAATGAGGGRTV